MKELGVRVALGANKRHILTLVLGSAMKLALIGVVIGTAAALAAARLVSSWLNGVQTHDPLIISSVSLGLLVIAALACYLPARRAIQVDPIIALRHE